MAATRSTLSRGLPTWGNGPTPHDVTLGMEQSAAGIAAALRDEPGFVWLDAPAPASTLFAFDPVATLTATGSSTTLNRDGEETPLLVDAFGAIEALLEVLPAETRLFGYLGYELAAQLEEVPIVAASDGDAPDLYLGVYDRWLEGRGDRWSVDGASAAAGREELRRRLREGRGDEGAGVANQHPAPPTRVSSQPDGPGFEAAVRRTLERIRAGEIFETNLCRRFTATWSLAEAWGLYRRLRAASPAEYGAYVRLADAAVLSISPECFLRRRGHAVESHPIKGTRARRDGQLDSALIAELQGSEKDAAELAMIVDLVRNDLGRVSVPGTVAVDDFAAPMVLPTVVHTVARVTARLRSEVGPAQLLRATFPPGSITGAPKIQAMRVSAAEEPSRRGPAMGAIGWIDVDGDLELSVAIRTALVTTNRVDYHAGGGIVADSDPGSEREETMAKARAFLQALGVD